MLTYIRSTIVANILIASLGESPVVVSTMYDLLTEREKLTLDQVIVLYPQGGMVKESYDLVEEARREKSAR